MFLTAHLAAGLIIGKLTNNYTAAIIGAMFVDIDHIFLYAKYKSLFNLKKLWKAATDRNDALGIARNWLHSIFPFALISSVLMLINFKFGFVFFLAYLSHLLLDAIDNSDYFPLYPLKYNVKGPIKYLSASEAILTILLIIIFLQI